MAYCMRSCLPLNSAPSILAIASSASARFTNLTKAKPRGSPLFAMCGMCKHAADKLQVSQACVKLLLHSDRNSKEFPGRFARCSSYTHVFLSLGMYTSPTSPNLLTRAQDRINSKVSGHLNARMSNSTSAHRTKYVCTLGDLGNCDSGRIV
jgi:hypothetical protein